MTLLIVGTIALDTIETPFGKKENILGGSAVHAAMSASFHTQPAIVGVVGKDFDSAHLEFLQSRSIDTSGVEIKPGATFRWSGYYEYDMNEAHTRDTKLNVLLHFSPQLSPELKKAEFIFLANLDPEIQIKALKQINRPKLVAMDTMNFWIANKKAQLIEAIKMVDIVLLNEGEARQLMETSNLPQAARGLLRLGAKKVIIKKGEHGALLFAQDEHFAAASYPQSEVKDPTGAGDSFAGGFMGHLAKTGDISNENIRRAIVIGSVMASFNVEDFSLNRLKTLTQPEISQRFAEFRAFSNFTELD